MSQSKSERAEKKNEDGKLLCELKQYDNAKKFFDEAIELNPNVAKYWNNRAACHIMMGNYFLALGDSKKAVTLDEKYSRGYKRLSKCNKVLDDLDLALKYIETAQKLDPKDKHCSEEIRTLKILKKYEIDIKKHLKNENYKEVLKIIEKYLKLVPESKKYRLLNAECLILLQDLKNGGKILYSILNVMPNDEDALYVKGLYDYYKDYITFTFESLQNVKRLIPDNLKISQLYRDAKKTFDFLHQVNEAKDDVNRLNDAYVFLDEALKIDPKNYNTNKKLLYQKITIANRCPELTSKIIPDCTEYLNKYEKNLDILNIRAQRYMKIQEFEDAIEDFEMIYSLSNTEENKKLLDNAKKMFDEQLKSNYKILKIEENEIDEIKIKKAFENLLEKYNLELKMCVGKNIEKVKAKIDRISKSFKEIMKGLESDEEVPKTGIREARKSVPRKASGKFSTIQRAKKCISQQNFTMANELLNKFSLQSGVSEETIYTQTSLIFYEKHITESFELIKQNYLQLSKHAELKKLFEKAQKTYNLFLEAKTLKEVRKPNEAYKLLTEAQKIDQENHVTNKDIFRKKIELGQQFTSLKYNVYKDCSLYLKKYGPDLEILQIRATHSLNIGEFEDAIDDFKELLSYESSETNERKLNEAKLLYSQESSDPYKILRIDRAIKEGSKIKKAFQDLLLLYHPDKNSWASAERKNKLERKLFRVKDAYEDIKKELNLNI